MENPLELDKSLYPEDKGYEKFERAEITSQQYCHYLMEILQIRISYNEFLEGWSAIYKGMIKEVVLAIKKIPNSNHVIALTNTNQAHVDVWAKLYPSIFDLFRKVYISNEIGLRKPDEECFLYVLEQEEVEAKDCIFF